MQEMERKKMPRCKSRMRGLVWGRWGVRALGDEVEDDVSGYACPFRGINLK